MSSDYFKVTIEDIDGDEIEVSGDTRSETVTIGFDVFDEGTGYESEITPQDARTLAAALVMAAGQAEGKGIGL
jgi:hypothetical protein